MDEDEAALLAELRAISNGSAGASRFQDSSNDEPAATMQDVSNDASFVSAKSSTSIDQFEDAVTGSAKKVDPSQDVEKKINEDADVVIAAPLAPSPQAAAAPQQQDKSEPEASENIHQSFGIQSSLPSTFQGERGGSAEDAELLAELRAISQKSSSADRFAGEESNATGGETNVSEPAQEKAVPTPKKDTTERTKSPSPRQQKTKRDSNALPPWKRGKKKTAAAEVDVVIAAPPAPAPEPQPSKSEVVSESAPQSFGIKSSMPSTFQGDRGGAAEDAELLAELRAISQKSSSADRFADESNDNGGNTSTSEPTKDTVAALSSQLASEKVSRAPPSPEASRAKSKSAVLPPWKRSKKKTPLKSSAPDVDIVVAAPPAPTPQPEHEEPTKAIENAPQGLGMKSSLPSTFQGDRGGSAEDAELLAELRAISAKSSGTDRFAEESSRGEPSAPLPVADVVEAVPIPKKETETSSRTSPKESKSKAAMLPPWKRGKKKKAEDVDVVIAAPPAPAQQPEPVETNVEENLQPSYGIKSSLPSTFQGDRGGSAEDEELLAELRAISAKSTGKDRFAEGDKGNSTEATNIASETVEVVTTPSQKTAGARPSPKETKPKEESSQLSPWKRFRSKKTTESKASNVDVVVAAPAPTPVQTEANQKAPQQTGLQSSLPSTFKGDRGGPAEDAELLAELRAVSSQPNGGIKSDLPSTFKGERGGSAEDADLLAELRAISSGAAGGNRFSDEPSEAPASSSNQVEDHPVAKKPEVSQDSSRSGVPSGSALKKMEIESHAPPSTPSASGDNAPAVTRDSLPSAVADKKWKLRKEAYTLLRSLLADRLKQGEGNGSIVGDTMMPGLDEAIPSMVADSNAGALDAALAFAVDYAEHCSGASSSELATKIVTSLIKGSALSSSRPSTSKSASALTLKLMEVGDEGYASVHAVSDVLLSQGLSSRKPKVVIATSGLILQASYSFGAGSLPLATISSTAPKMLSHSNATVRETGLKIIAEVCRALGSKKPLQDLIDGMKKAQLSQLDSLLEAQPEPTPVSVGLRTLRGSSSSQSPADALAALEAGAKELEAKRFAEREPVNILQALPKTDYSTRIKLPKWSEKVAALDIVLECGGEKPYKLVQPSSSVNYSPLISEMKALLSHSHFAVASKSMKVLAMLAEGVGAGLFPHLRPLLSQLIMLSKDKKLNRTVGECVDVLFGNVMEIEHLLDKDDALPSVLNEKKQKNALVRASALDFLGRCIKRGESAGPRGRITGKSAAAVARLCCEKLEDSDASVRKAATECLRSLLAIEDAAIADTISPIIESLQSKNSRAYKSLRGSGGAVQRRVGPSGTASPRKRPASGSQRTQSGPPKTQQLSRTSDSERSAKQSASARSRPAQSSSKAPSVPATRIEDTVDAPSLEEAITLIASMNVPSWDAPDDDGGVLAGLKSSKWLLRQNAILNLAAFSKGDDSPVGTTDGFTAACVVLVKEHTKGFKETNVNVTKASMQLFIALSQSHTEKAMPFPSWACRDGVRLAVDKIADKKLSALSCKLLSELCCVRPPQGVLESGISCLDKVKSPLGHEAFLKWFKDFLNDFGAPSVTSALKSVAPWLVKECESTNPKVRKMALAVAGELHSQLGPVSRALILSSCGDSASVKTQLERVFDENPFDPDASKVERSRACVVLQSNSATGSNGEATASSVLVDLPKIDLPASLPNDCIEKMGSKEGKNAWKLRKQALDDVEAAVNKSNGLISTDALKPLVELLRALRERLSDSQSNLKPVAARTIGSILGSVDTVSQAKLGKIVYAPLVSAVMNDNRKPMRQMSLEAIRVGTTASSVEGGKPNRSSLESLMVSVVGELSESEFKAGGLPDVLMFITGVAEFLPNLDSIASARAQTLGDKFAAAMVGCLTSSKSETRSTAEKLLTVCIENDKLSLKSVKKGMKNLLPAQQRTVIPIVARLPHPSHPGSPNNGKENSVPSPPRGSRQRKPPGVAAGASTSSSPRQRRRPETSRRPEGRAKPAPSSQADDSFEAESREQDDLHPLIANGEPGKKPLPSSRRINWPEHPEEPNSPGQMNALKKLWSRSLPSRSVAALFPAGGIKKQEDAMAGCALLCKAIEKDRAGKEEAIVDHIDVIFMWTSFALCSRESTVGLQSLITLLLRLFSFLEDHQYKISDNEAYILLPHVFEKASIAKGRFREQFNSVISFFRSDAVLPTRSLGQVICVPLIEHSHQSKTRVLALHECRTCVDRVGLSGLGKRGLLATAKTLSEESLPENRIAALELMETVLAKMDGDVEKLASICGTAYLSDKARVMIEERWAKHSGSRQTMAQKSLQRDDRSRRHQSQIPSSRAAAGATRIRSRAAPAYEYEASPSPDREELGHATTEGLRDELPSLKLQLDDVKTTGISSSHTSPSAPVTGPFTFSFDSTQPATEPSDEKDEVIEQAPISSFAVGARTMPGVSSSSAPLDTAQAPTEGAAASLRARLLKIREKHKEEHAPPAPTVSASTLKPELSPSELSSPLTEPPIEGAVEEELGYKPENSYDSLRTCIEELLHTKPPVPEAHPRLRDCTAALKKYHAAISNQPGNMSNAEFLDLRQNITDKTVETIENLTSVVVFAFDCEFPENTAGMSIPLLSVALATLMALFRDTGLSQKVTQDALALLIREAGKALLDPRLAMSSHHAATSQLDEATSSQMVRAINKLAVQAATGSPRDVAIEALLALQLQLCTIGNETAADAAFNSRLSRIVTKLFAKVLKAEAASARPFSPETVDVEAIICALEDMLVATAFAPGAPNRNRQDAVETCSNMGRSLMIPILNARGEGGLEEIRATMDELGIDSRESKLALLVTSCEFELDYSATVAEEEKLQSAPPSPAKAAPSMNIASLVSELSSAPEGPERDAAVAALRRYNELHGKAELHDHLREVSGTFRAYIMEQLDESSSSPEKPSAVGESSIQSIPMSERIRFLRSKLNATEAAIQSAVEPTATVRPTVQTEEKTAALSQPTTPSRRIPEPSTPSRRSAAEARLTPSRIPKTSSSFGSDRKSPSSQSTGTALSLRERLAAAQKNRAKAAAESESQENAVGTSSTSAYGQAAALRARLEAVKQQSKREHD